MRKSAFAFTLIELLIVVAIIAILAAIAVPNFLEAQVRSKVSRAHADMRSIATALEAYSVDYNHPPPSGKPGNWYKERDGAGWVISWIDRLVPITTPVSYITSVPLDPFAINGKLAASAIPPRTKIDFEAFQYCDDYHIPRAMRILISPNGDGRGYVSGGSSQIDVCWRLVSMGPDRTANFLDVGGIAGVTPYERDRMEYDATNGTISHGDIFRYGGNDQGNANP